MSFSSKRANFYVGNPVIYWCNPGNPGNPAIPDDVD